MMQDKLIEHKHYIDQHGQDLPEIRNWKWSVPKMNLQGRWRLRRLVFQGDRS